MPNTVNDWKTIAIIHNPDRKQFWKEVFGADIAPVKSFAMTRANLPGYPRALIYKLDLKALSPEIRARLVNHLSTRWNLTPAEVESDLEKTGMPILAEDVTIQTR